MNNQGHVNSRVDKALEQQGQTLNDIKSQLTLLTQALTLNEKGKLPTQPQPNLARHMHSTDTLGQTSSSHEQVQAITTLRSGKVIDKTILPRDPSGRGDTPNGDELLGVEGERMPNVEVASELREELVENELGEKRENCEKEKEEKKREETLRKDLNEILGIA